MKHEFKNKAQEITYYIIAIPLALLLVAWQIIQIFVVIAFFTLAIFA